MKKFFVLLITLIAISTFAQGKITVGATAVPHAEILNKVVKPLLAKQKITLVVKEFNDYVAPNIATDAGELDANYFQHIPYLESFTKDRGIVGLVSVAGVHLEPIGIYSKKFKSLADLKDGAKVSIPNDPSNEARALILFEKQGLIKLADSKNLNSTIKDITENPKNISFVELNAEQIPRAIADVDFAVINSNYALQSKINPTKDALVLESGKDNPYTNILVVKETRKSDPLIVALIKAITSPEVKAFIEKTYGGAVIPAF